jgi:hypothetical protein
MYAYIRDTFPERKNKIKESYSQWVRKPALPVLRAGTNHRWDLCDLWDLCDAGPISPMCPTGPIRPSGRRRATPSGYLSAPVSPPHNNINANATMTVGTKAARNSPNGEIPDSPKREARIL